MRRLARFPVYLPIAVVAGILSWPGVNVRFQPGETLDSSWQAGLHMASRLRLDFGEEILFTYGPLGFLAVPTPFYTSTFVLSGAATLAAHFGVVAVVANALSRAFGLLATAVLTFVFASTAVAGLELPELLMAVVVAVCTISALGNKGELRSRTAVALAVLAALIMLVKLSAGVLALCVLGVAMVMPLLRAEERARRARAAGLVFVAYLTALVGLWLLTGQPVENLATFIGGSADVVSGYSEGMASDEGLRWDYFAALVATALIALLVVRATKGRDWATRLLVGGVFAGFLLGAFRAGFTREGYALFSGSAAVAMTGLAMREHRRLFVLAAVPLLVSAVALQLGPEAVRRINLERGPKAMVQTARLLASEPRREAVRRKGRMQLRQVFRPRRLAPKAARRRVRMGNAAAPLSGDALSLMSGRTVHVDPWEAKVVWAYPELRWRPVPVFQMNLAYTSDLDALNADFLASSAAPDFILTRPQTTEWRVPWWESPNYVKEIVCRYRQVLASPPWQVLSHDRDRCGPPVELARRRVGFGQTVPVPQGLAANDMVLARFEDMDEPLQQSVRALLLWPEFLYARLGRRQDFRFLRGHAGGLHVMRFPKCLGSPPFASVSLHTNPRPGQIPSEPGSYSIAFFAVSFDCPKPSGSR